MTEPVSYDCPSCGEEIELQMEIDPGESNWGADADGNRGMYVAPGAIPPTPPDCCPHCGYEPTVEELLKINSMLEHYAREWYPEPEPDYPDDDYEE